MAEWGEETTSHYRRIMTHKPPVLLKYKGPNSPIKMMIRENLAFFMAAVNGLLLTIVSFLVSGMFVNEMVSEETQNLKASVEKIVLADVQKMETDFHFLASVLSAAASDDTIDSRIAKIRSDRSMYVNFDQSTFSGIYFVGTSLQATDIRTLYSRSNNAVHLSSQQIVGALEKYRQIVENRHFINIAVEETLMPVYRISERPDVMARDFLLVKYIAKSSPEANDDGLLVAVVNPRIKSPFVSLAQVQGMSLYVVYSDNGKQQIYRWNKDSKEGDKGTKIVFSFEMPVGSTKGAVNCVLDQTPQMSFLFTVPWLLLVFLGSLTVFVMLFVWKSQSSSRAMTRMVAELEKKNAELGTEVNERERLNHVLRKSERENKAIINAISDVIFEISLSGEILFLNDAWTRLSGTPIGQAMGKNLFDMIHPNDQEEQKKFVSQLIKGLRSSYRAMTSVRTAEGKYRAVEMTISMIRMDENRNMRVVGSFTDIEERQNMAIIRKGKRYDLRTMVFVAIVC